MQMSLTVMHLHDKQVAPLSEHPDFLGQDSSFGNNQLLQIQEFTLPAAAKYKFI